MQHALALAILLPGAISHYGSHDRDMQSGENAAFHNFEKAMPNFNKMEHTIAKEQQHMIHAAQIQERTAGNRSADSSRVHVMNITFGPGGRVQEKDMSCINGDCKTKVRHGHVVTDNGKSNGTAQYHNASAAALRWKAAGEKIRNSHMMDNATEKAKIAGERKAAWDEDLKAAAEDRKAREAVERWKAAVQNRRAMAAAENRKGKLDDALAPKHAVAKDRKDVTEDHKAAVDEEHKALEATAKRWRAVADYHKAAEDHKAAADEEHKAMAPRQEALEDHKGAVEDARAMHDEKRNAIQDERNHWVKEDVKLAGKEARAEFQQSEDLKRNMKGDEQEVQMDKERLKEDKHDVLAEWSLEADKQLVKMDREHAKKIAAWAKEDHGESAWAGQGLKTAESAEDAKGVHTKEKKAKTEAAYKKDKAVRAKAEATYLADAKKERAAKAKAEKAVKADQQAEVTSQKIAQQAKEAGSKAESLAKSRAEQDASAKTIARQKAALKAHAPAAAAKAPAQLFANSPEFASAPGAALIGLLAGAGVSFAVLFHRRGTANMGGFSVLTD